MSESQALTLPVPAQPGNCVSVGPPGPGIIIREPDLQWRAPESMAQELVLTDRQYLIEEHSVYCHIVQRLNTLQAVQSCSQWQVDFDPATEKVTVHWLRVHREGRVIDHTDPARFRCLQREENLERCVIDGGASLLVLLEDIRPGDLLDTALTVVSSPRLMRAHYSHFSCVSYAIHVGWLFVSFRFREDRPLAWRSNIAALVPIESGTGEGMKELRWERRGIRPFIMEENVPGWHLQGGWIQLSDFASWQEVASGLHEAWSIHSGPAELDEALDHIRASAEDRSAQVEQAIRFVQDDIRYLSVNVELGGQIPSAPGTVLRRRFGDCKDKALLLARLLRALGVRAHPLLVHTRLRGELRNWLPSPFFNHAIVSYQLDGRWYCVDATISLQGGGPARRAVPRYEAGLPVAETGVAGLQTVEPAPGSDGRLRLEEKFEMDPGGRASDLFVKLRVTGSEADHLRASLHHQGVDAVARSREQFYRSLHPGLIRLGTMEWSDDRGVNALTLAERFELPDRRQSIPTPHHYFVEHSAHAITGYLPGTSELNRKRPWQLPFPVHAEQVVECASPSLPVYSNESDTAQCPEWTFTWMVKPSLGTVKAVYRLEVLADEVPAEGLARHMEALKRLHRRKDMAFNVPRSRQVLARRGDGPLLDDHSVTIALVDRDIARGKEAGLQSAASAIPWLQTPAFPSPSGADPVSEQSRADPLAGMIRKSEELSPPVDFSLPDSEGSSQAAPPPDIIYDHAPPAPPVPAREEPPPAPRRRRRPQEGRPKKRLSGNARLGLWGCAVIIGGIPLIGLLAGLGSLVMEKMGMSAPEATVEDYQEANGRASRDPELSEAYRLFFQGKVAESRRLFDAASGKYPLSLRVQLLGARLATAEGNFASAGAILEKWMKLYPGEPELRDIRVDLLLAKGENAEAVRVALVNAGLPDAPPESLFQLARAHVAAGDPARAEPLLRQFLTLEVTDLRARSLLGTVYQETGRTGEILKMWQETLSQFPQDPNAAVLAGKQLVKAGLKAEARSVLEAAFLRVPGSAPIAFQYAGILNSEGETRQAIDLFRRASALDPAWMDPAVNLALMLESANNGTEAANAWELAADRSPQQPAALILHGKSLSASSALGAQIFFERALLLSLDSPEAWELLAQAYSARGLAEKAAAARRQDPSVLPVRK